jgi:hypothetical protein
MPRSSFVARLAASAGAACTATLLAGCATPSPPALEHPAITRYVSGWKQLDGARVASAFAPGATYRDPSLAAPVDATGIPAQVDAHREAQFELLGAQATGEERVELRWKVRWPKRQAQFDYVDSVQLSGGSIASVTSTAAVSPEAVAVMAAYEMAHDDPTPARIDALFAKDVEVYGSTLPPTGLRYDSYIAFLERLRGTTFRRRADVPLALTKDGRIVMYWTLQAGPKQLAAGVDHITVENGRIRKIVGIY